jgi:hypothetical protein
MELPANWTAYGIIALCAGAMIVMLLTSSVVWRLKLTRWALDEGVTLISFRNAAFWEGPGKHRRRPGEQTFRVEAIGPNGNKRKGWATFVTHYGMSLSATFDSVRWDGWD